jgi:two-component system sensor histidine kinase BaeS
MTVPATSPARGTLTSRLVALGVLTALLSVLVAGAFSVRFVRQAAEEQARATLARQADVAADLVTALPREGRDDLSAFADALAAQGITAAVAVGGGPVELESGLAQVPAVVVTTARAAGSASAVVGPPPTLVEARSLRGAGPGQGPVGPVLVLAQPRGAAVDRVAGPVLLRLAAALGLGLLLAGLAGAAAARRLARPLATTAAAARALSRGEREVRVEPDGPAEVAAVADALNSLSDALAASEERQRRFLLSVSHELRTPLTSIRGYGEALADGVLDEASARGAGAVVRDEADRLDRMLADLLDLARSEAEDFRLDLVRLDLRDVVEGAARAWAEPCRQAGVRLQVELPSEPVLAVADEGRSRQVVDALVANAVRVVPAGAPLVLAAADAPPRLQVRDGGPGLGDDDLEVAFQQGALRDRYEGSRPVGSGLGLALVARLVHRMGGSVMAGHAPEGGAQFTVTLPAWPGPAAPSASPGGPRPA